jgi:RpiB/LacA/LacB family sugar-phosphate isomerase
MFLFILNIFFFGAYYGFFQLKVKLVLWLTERGEEVEDLGAEKLEKDDDFVDYAMDVAEQVLESDDAKGIVICRNGVGVSIVANRYPGIRCVLGFDAKQVEKARTDDAVNVLALPADYKSLDEVKTMVDAFLSTKFSGDDRFVRRLTKIEQMTEDCDDECGCGGDCSCEDGQGKKKHECVCGGDGECQCGGACC